MKQTSQKPPSAQLQPPLLPSDQPGSSTSGIRSILDQVFLGKPARSSTHSLDIDGIPLVASVSIKLRQKIWCNAFIDLKALLDSKDGPFLLPFQPGLSFCIRAKSPKFPSHSASGLMLFFIFSAIYLEKFPTEAPNLLKYCHMIRKMQYLHGDQAFRMYDENFRKLRETVNVPWQNPVQELRLKAATTKFQFQVFNKRLHTCVHRAFSFRGITFARREKNKIPFLLFSVCRQSDWGMRFDHY